MEKIRNRIPLWIALGITMLLAVSLASSCGKSSGNGNVSVQMKAV